MSENQNDTAQKSAPVPPRFAAAAPLARAKMGDVVTYWEDPSAAPRHAVVLAVGADGSASLKVIMPATRKGGGGVARREGVAFADKATKGCWGLA